MECQVQHNQFYPLIKGNFLINNFKVNNQQFAF